MSSIPPNMPFTLKGMPIYPGAFMVNGGGSFPIFCSIANLQNCYMSDIDNYYIIMPGYKLVVYADFYPNGSFSSKDNYSSNKIINYFSPYQNGTTSCRLYFSNDGINENEIIISGIS